MHKILTTLILSLTVLTARSQVVIQGNVYGGGNAGNMGGKASVTVYGGDIGKVYGGARQANVGGSASVHIDGSKISDDIIINYVYGGNDISGTVGSSTDMPAHLSETTANGIDNSCNAFVATTPERKDGDGKQPYGIFIGQLYGGGNGDYEYSETTDGDGYYTVSDKQTLAVIEKSSRPFVKPELAKAYLEIKGGTIAYVFGGGNNATVTKATDICIDNSSLVTTKIPSTAETNADNKLLRDGAARLVDMGIAALKDVVQRDKYQFSRVFGGNNHATMAIRPTWHLQRGVIENLYSGGNAGDMTSPVGLLLEIPANVPQLEVYNVYGGCRKADVRPQDNAGNDVTVSNAALNDSIGNGANYKFPDELAARLLVRGGIITNVYGGNDISGKVYGGNAVGIYTTVFGDVYGGGNGSYAYTDNANLRNHVIYGDYFYERGAKSAVEALNDFRPNAEQVSIRLAGQENKPTIIHGGVYVGGNSATLVTTRREPIIELKIGSHVIADCVFLGNNGENMVKSNDADLENGISEGVLRTLGSTTIASDGSRFNSMDLTNSTQFATYMNACTATLMPRVVFDNIANGDPDTYQQYTTAIGSLFCGGNVGSMAVDGTTSLNFRDRIIIFDKLVGGCNNANVAQTEFNARYEGGLTGTPDATTGNKLEMNFNGLRIQPKRWATDGSGNYLTDANGNHYLEWNTISAATGLPVPPVTSGTGTATAADLDRRLSGGNVYGGCYNSGHVNGNIVINLNTSLVDRKGEYGIFDEIAEKEGEAVLYGNSSYNITARHTGVLLSEQGMDPLGSAANVFGGGYGEDSEVWGSTTINLNAGYTFQIFGGGEHGAIGRGVRDTNGKLQYTEYNAAYSTTVNLNGSQAGVYRGYVDATDDTKSDSPDMAEAEFIYGGGFFAPIVGNTTVNLGNGRIFNAFAGSCNADILGHTETFIGRNGFPWIRDHIYGGNDLGGEILGSDDMSSMLDEATLAKVYNPAKREHPDVLRASAYMEYVQGRVGYIFGGCYGYYDYSDSHYKDYTYSQGDAGIPEGKSAGMARDGFIKPRMDNAFVHFKPNSNTRNEVAKIYGAGQGYTGDSDRDVMQDRSYVLINIPGTVDKFQNMEVFGAGDYSGVGMRIDSTTARQNADSVTAAAVIDLLSGRIKDVFGASYKEGITRRTIVNVPAGSTINVKRIFGGAYGVSNEKPCDVFEANVNFSSADAVADGLPTDIDEKGYQTAGGVYGGNNSYRRTLYSRVNISSAVRQSNGWTGRVFGAGYGENTWSQYTEVNLLAGADVYEAYGGGFGGMVLNKLSATKLCADDTFVSTLGSTYAAYDDVGLDDPLVITNALGKRCNTNVNINRGAYVGNYCYAGGLGAKAVVCGTTFVGLLGGTVKKDIYAGGTSGAVMDKYRAGGFVATTNAYIEGGTVRNVYGGSWEGPVGLHTGTAENANDATSDVPGATNVVIGIRPDQATLPDGYGFYKGVPAVQRNVYGGGEGGAVYGTANVTFNNGYVGYTYNAADNSYHEKIDDETWTDGVGKNRLADCGNVYGGGYDDNSSVDTTNVTIWNGHIRNSVFGGGEIATIGRGATEESGRDNSVRALQAIHKAGETHIYIYNGNILRNVFGGGKGYNLLSYGRKHQFYTDGYVFGRTDVNIFGGNIGTTEGIAQGYGNIFGGGDVGYIYSPSYYSTKTQDRENTTSPNHIYYYDSDGNLSEDCRVVVSPMLQVRPGHTVTYEGRTYQPYEYVPTDYLNTLKGKDADTGWADMFTGDGDGEDERGVHIYNAVFGGGNVSSNNESYANAVTIFGNTTATLYDVFHRDFITVGTEHTGGLYGGGNLSVVGGYRELNITNYGTDYYGLDQQISLEVYKKLSNRERAYFKLEYMCMTDVTINGKDYKTKNRISEDEYNALPEQYRNETYWQQYGFCSIYAGRLLNTIQRADLCGVYGSRMVLQGAKDRQADVADATVYTINRVGELSLNKQQSRVSGESLEHGNYFGIYSVVNYLGNLTSDVRFDQTYKKYDEHAADKSATVEGTTYASWKVGHLTKKERNNGVSMNQVALASGVFLELTTEESATAGKKKYGYITGIIELDLINVKKDIEGGGYVYARNEHGRRSYHPERENVVLSPYNQTREGYRLEARTYKRYEYDQANLQDYQSSGNFIHRSKRIVDDCYPNIGIYNDGYQKSPAHYWYIKGEVYIYDQIVSAYAGSASAYSKEVHIPLTITAGSHGKLKLLNIQPNLYAYYGDYTQSGRMNSDGVKVDNERYTFHLNDVITWWDWHQLSDSERKLFVKSTYVNADSCYVDGTFYPAGTLVREHDPSLHGGDATKTDYSVFMAGSHTVLDKSGKSLSGLAGLMHPSNNISHDTGYALTFDVNSPTDWNDYYTPVTGSSVSGKKRKDEYDALDAGKKSDYIEGPTYTLRGESGLYGQRHYEVGEILTREVYDDYVTTVGTMTFSGQAQVEPAYVAVASVGNTQAGSAIPESAFNALADQSNYKQAMVCTNSIQIGHEEYVLNGELVAGTDANLAALAAKYKVYNNSLTNSVKVNDAEALAYVRQNLSDAYYCTHEGLYGGQYFHTGQNYSVLKAWSALSNDRDKFKFNYDALDVLIDPTYPGEGHTSVYDYDADHLLYSAPRPVEYKAAYTGTGTLTYYDNNGTSHTITSSSAPISREDYENVLNEQCHYTRVEMAVGENIFYIIDENFIDDGIPFARGRDISQKDYSALSDANKQKVHQVTYTNTGTLSVTMYYCYETFNEDENGKRRGDIISSDDFANLKNYQKLFTIQGMEPTEKTTLYVSRESSAKDVTSERVISVVYQYTYYEDDDEGEGVSLTNELHVVNIHLQLESGVPEIGQLLAPPTILPGNTINMKAPSVEPGLYEVLYNGWEMYSTADDAENHRNGVQFLNNTTPIYWYQNQKVWVAFFSKTYLGKTYSNPVQLSVANYHNLADVLADTEHHMYVDYDPSQLMRDSKIYITDATQGLSQLRSFLDLSFQNASKPDGHAPLNPDVRGGENLDFFLRTDLSNSGAWTPMAAADGECFTGTLHGDGHTVSGLSQSLFGNLCGNVYNLGVTGSFTSGGIADSGSGYIENSWIKTSATSAFTDGVNPVFGHPTRGEGTQLVNCYYPSSNGYKTTDYGRGMARAMSDRDFYTGTVAYNLNGFYLQKRYSDAHGLTNNGYVEDRYSNKDFIYADGTIPESIDERQQTVNDGTKDVVTFTPIFPDDYLFFGQKLTYGYDVHEHQPLPSVIAKSGGRLSLLASANRVLRAPAYYGSKTMGAAHFNAEAYLPAFSAPRTVTDTDLQEAFSGMTAIDFAGHGDLVTDTDESRKSSFRQGWNDDLFYQPLLDDSGLTAVNTSGLTQNLLVYMPSESANKPTRDVLKSYFTEPSFADFYSDDYYRSVASAADASLAVTGHLVDANLTAFGDHLLVDRQDFNCPLAYQFAGDDVMWYQRTPDRYADRNSGWETVSLPFTAELVSTDQKGELTHFYRGADTDDSGRIGHEYWLRSYRDLTGVNAEGQAEAVFASLDADSDADAKEYTNTFLWDYYYQYGTDNRSDKNGDVYHRYYSESHSYEHYPLLTADTPYIIGFPGSSYYEFDLSGAFDQSSPEIIGRHTAEPVARLRRQVVSFVSPQQTEVSVTDDIEPVSHNGYLFRPNYQSASVAATGYTMTSDGSSFTHPVGTVRAVPFRPYFVKTGSAGAPEIVFTDISDASSEQLPSADGGLLISSERGKIVVTSAMRTDATVRIHTVSGISVAAFTIQPGQTVVTPVSATGVYIVNRKKLLVK